MFTYITLKLCVSFDFRRYQIKGGLILEPVALASNKWDAIVKNNGPPGDVASNYLMDNIWGWLQKGNGKIFAHQCLVYEGLWILKFSYEYSV